MLLELPSLWKITINYIVLLLSTEYDADEKGELENYDLMHSVQVNLNGI